MPQGAQLPDGLTLLQSGDSGALPPNMRLISPAAPSDSALPPGFTLKSQSQPLDMYHIPADHVAMTDTSGQLQAVHKTQTGAMVQQGWKVGPPMQQPGYNADPTAGTPYEGIAKVGNTAIDAIKAAPQFGKSVLTGLKHLAFYEPSKGETPNNSGPEMQVARPMVTAGQQAISLYKQGQPVKATVTGLAALDPFAAGPISQINQLQAEGRERDARSAAILNSLFLAAGTGPGKSATSSVFGAGTDLVRRVPDAFSSGLDTMSRIPDATKAAFTRTAVQKLGTAVKPPDVGAFQSAASIVLPDLQRASSRLGKPIASADDALAAIANAKQWETNPQKLSALTQLESDISTAPDRITSQTPSIFTSKARAASDAYQQGKLNTLHSGIADAFASLPAPDVTPNPQVLLSSSSTAMPFRGITQTRPPRGITHMAAPLDNGIGSSTAFPSNVRPELQPRQLQLVPSTPARDLAGTLTAARMPNVPDISSGLVPRENLPEAEMPQGNGLNIGPLPDRFRPIELQPPTGPAPSAVDIKAQQTMTPDYLGRHGSALDQARAEWQTQNPGQPVPAWSSDIMRRAGEIDAQMRQGATAPTPKAADIFQNDQEMQDWLDKQERNNPTLQRIKDKVREQIRQGNIPDDLRPEKTLQEYKAWQNIQSMITEAEGQGVDTPAQLDAIDQWIRRTNKPPKPYAAATQPLKTSPAVQQGELTPQVPTDANTEALLRASLEQINAKKAAAATAPRGITQPTVMRGITAEPPPQSFRGITTETKPIDPTSPVAAQISALKNELIRTTDPAQRADIQQAINRYQAIASGQPYHAPEQAIVENLPLEQPRTIEPGTYNRETKQTTLPSSAVRPAASLKPGEAAMVPTSDLHADPARFQYKGGTNEQGVTNALKEQNSYDPNKGGVLLTWKDPADGKTYVVNGHHRFELAQRAGEPAVLARAIDAPDAATAKVIGAETNISEGHGSIVDAARFFKAANIKTAQDAMNRNLPMGQGKVTDGLAMARLDSSILDKVESGAIPEGRAVAIGKVTDSPTEQEATLQAIAKREGRTGKTLNNGEVESIARQVRDADTRIEQGADLFGSFNREQSLFGEQAEIDDYILKQLGSDKRTFGAVSSKGRAEALGKVEGQQINAAENQRISGEASQAAEIYKKLVNGPGVLNDIRTNAAKELAGRYSKTGEIKAKAYERIRQVLQEQIGQRP